MDMPNFAENLEKFKEKYPDKEIFPISALTHEGLEPLLIHLRDVLDEIKEEKIYTDDEYESTIIYRFKNEKPYTITKEDGIWVLKGEEIEKLFKMTRFTEDEGVKRFARKLKGMGVDEELERLGAKPGDEVQILEYVFEWKE